ncbi:MBL fold metallo-hydrolase [Sorangium sp. So ce1335]|uniref:MBL fold metallo-hydrolase n=1 Tax=Sorangium sp. So ce1335 TaxID=3133335 RepID=UPI003F5F8B53
MAAELAARSLPRPGPDEIGVYFVGPGFGESQVVLMPGGLCVVVDSCVHGSENLTLSLLQQLAVEHVDLLAVTHPDLDHIRGLPRLLAAYPPRRVWRYPAGTIRDLVAFWCRQDPEDTRMKEVHDALLAIDALEQKGVAHEAHFQTRPRRLSDECEVWCLAPTGCDQRHARAQLRRLVQRAEDEPALSEALRAYLVGERSLGDRPNTLSLALVVRHGGRRILLAGDVENGRSREDASGWKGVIMSLREDNQLREIQALDVVKVAHHGSDRAFTAAAWRLHAKGDGSTVAIVTPFDRSAPPLPREGVLKDLRAYAGALGITAGAAGALDRARCSGWVAHAAAQLPANSSHLAILFGASGPARLYAGPGASFFHR